MSGVSRLSTPVIIITSGVFIRSSNTSYQLRLLSPFVTILGNRSNLPMAGSVQLQSPRREHSTITVIARKALDISEIWILAWCKEFTTLTTNYLTYLSRLQIFERIEPFCSSSLTTSKSFTSPDRQSSYNSRLLSHNSSTRDPQIRLTHLSLYSLTWL